MSKHKTDMSYFENLGNSKKYHYRARLASNYVTSIDNQYDIVHDTICEMIEHGGSWRTCSNRIKSRIRRKELFAKGVENPYDSNFGVVGFEEIRIRHKKRNYAGFNKKACKYFNVVNDLLKWDGYPQGMHAMNGGEKRFGRYFVDFYIPDYDIVVEYNEAHHYASKAMISYDTNRKRYIEKCTNIPIIIIHEDKETIETCKKMIIDAIEYSIEKKMYK